MTVHKLSAGDGYAYYTSEVASADELRAGDRELGDYYTVEGMPPGQWVGHSEQLLGVSGEVTEAQMKALFGEGIKPNAAQILANGGTKKDVALGKPYLQFGAADTEMTRRIEEESARFRRLGGPAWSGPENADKALPKDVLHEIRSRVGGELFRESHGRNARSDEELAQYVTAQTTPKQQTVAGYDLVFSPAKSVSVLWALGGDEARRVIETAHNEAIAETITFLEKNATYTRRGAQGVRQIDVDGGLVATQFRHYDSRAGDPQLHDHVVIANKVMGTDGKWSSLDGRTLYKMNVAASETYNAKVIEKVCASLGVSTVARAAGGGEPIYEVAGIDLDTIHRASSRRSDIAGTIGRLEAEFADKHGYAPNEKQKIALAQQATLETRPEKKSARRLSELVEEWQQDYSSSTNMPVGPDLLEHVRNASTGTPVGALVNDLDAHEHARLVVHELAAKRAVWGRNHVIAQTRRHLKEAFPGQTITDETVENVTREATGTHSLQVTPDTITPKLAEFLRADGTSQFQQADVALFTSQEVLNAEHRVLAAGQKIVIPAVSAERFDTLLSQHVEAAAASGGPVLSQGQIDLARAFATDEKLLTLGIGPAGAGKTKSLSLAADAVRDSGGKVIGLAPTAAAAAVMSKDIGADATTIDAFLISHRNQQGQQSTTAKDGHDNGGSAFALGAGDVIIVDEAGMVTTPKLAEVVAVARRNGAVVRAIGDDRQLGAIGSGGALRLLNNEVGAVRLEEVHRFHTEGEADASLALREPATVGADTPFQWYVDNQRVTAGTLEAMTQNAFTAWMTDTAAGKTSLMIATDNATVTDLNARAQAARIATGDLTDGVGPITESTPSVVLRDGLRAYPGDTVVTRRNDRTLQLNQGKDFVKNNDVWTVEQVTANPTTDHAAAQTETQDRQRITLRHSGHRGRITVNADYLSEHGQLGYAATVHRAQGATVDTAHAILDERTDRAGAYVAATRGRETNKLYVALGDDRDVRDQTVTRDSVLASITANHDRTLSAHETVRAEAVRTGDVATFAGVYNDVEAAAWTAKTRGIAQDVMGQEAAAAFTSHESWGAVATHLRRAENEGLDASTVLAQAYRERGFAGADDASAVLAFRVENRIETAQQIRANTGQRPLGALTDDHLDRLAQQAEKHAEGADTGQLRRTPGEAPMDTEWAARPFALLHTSRLTETRDNVVERLQSVDPTASISAATRKEQWMVKTMTLELERRQDLSPTQTAIERAARGEDPRSAHQVTIAEAIRQERQLREAGIPSTSTPASTELVSTSSRTVTSAGGAGFGRTTISEDLAPSVLLQDARVPVEYRDELDRLRAHLGQRVMVRGAQLAEEQPAWAAALGPVPAKESKAAEWHSIAAETEAYRNRYNIGTHETAMIPKQYQDDPVAQRLVERATALHKHSALTHVPPRSAAQVQQTADEAAITDRMTANQAAARRAIERLQAERAAASDPLPAPQQREARIVDAIQSTDSVPAAVQPAGTPEVQPQRSATEEAAIERAIARHRAVAEKSAGTSSSDTSGSDSEAIGQSTSSQKKESTVSQEKGGTAQDAARKKERSQRQAELIQSRKATAAERQARETASGKNDSAAAKRRAEQAKNSGRSL
ncbi:conjugal transfer protein TraA [Arthrobacter cheniae]|uniref:Conjugal transfer protein TraA n=1 Tax=Arthrobacter cheniae TaxID=1258888 RepID=A0A3A5LYA6_9MICC|nr:MobF family relaxase [Arthrobacter cheniae]RJT76972.1 conjugal transfer protein TraA [Arthrobacter cheniae]